MSTEPTSTDAEGAWSPDTTAVWASIAAIVALCLLLVSTVIDQQRSIATLTKIDTQQTTTATTAHRAEDQLSALAKGVQQLSDQGDANATAVIGVLKRNGVNIKGPNAPAPAAPAASAP